MISTDVEYTWRLDSKLTSFGSPMIDARICKIGEKEQNFHVYVLPANIPYLFTAYNYRTLIQAL